MNLNIVFLLCFAITASVSGKTERIIGGTDVNIGDYPFIVSIRNKTLNKHFCGGTIISERHILTAAHCVFNKNYNDVEVSMGTACSMGPSGNRFNVIFVAVHPEFTGDKKPSKGSRNDLAILMLDKDIRFDLRQMKGTLQVSEVNDGDMVEIIGWGLTHYPSDTLSPLLKRAATRLITNKSCKKKIRLPINDGHVCTEGKKRLGVCIADSGGPLISNGKIVGVSSFCIPCAKGYPDVFTRIPNYLDFINSVVTQPFTLSLSA